MMTSTNMKRRQFFQAALAVAAGSAVLLGQGPVTVSSGMEYPKIDAVMADQAAVPEVKFFSAAQLAALRKLSELMMPGAGLEAGVPEFLYFWVGPSPAGPRKIYTAGLDALNKAAGTRYKKALAELSEVEAASVIEPFVKIAWNFVPPAEPLAHFLQQAKKDIRAAAMNSREFAAGQASAGGGRRQDGMGTYWNSLD